MLKIVSLLIFLLISPITIFAQSSATTGSIVGSVRDSQGQVLVGAQITVKQLETNLIRETSVSESGTYQVVQLPPGHYQITAQQSGFNSDTNNFVLTIGTTLLADFALQVAGNSDVIEVKASQTAVDRTESSTNIDTNRIVNLPINQRTFLDFALTSARVTRDRVPAQGRTATSGLSFNGQPARFNNITIDGVDNNDQGTGSVRSSFSQEAIQEFQVVSDNYSAEFGRALGGVINIVTKTGSNDLHGSIFNFTRNDMISARDAFSLVKPEFKQYQFGATLGGPIKKDRIFFFTAFERLSLKQNNIVTISDDTVQAARRRGFTLNNGPVPFARGTTSLLARIDAQINANDRLSFRYNGGFTYNGSYEPFGGLIGETNGGIQKLKDNSFAFNNTYISTKYNLINETRVLYNQFDQDVLAIENSLQNRLIAPEGQVTFGRNTSAPEPRRVDIFQFVDNVTMLRGRQQIKFGIDYSSSNLDTRLPVFGRGLTVFNALDFAQLSNMPGLPFFTGLQAFDPSLRTDTQRAFLMLLSGVLPIQSAGFPAGVPLADLPLPATYVQGFGNPSVKAQSKLFSTFVQDDIKIKRNLLVKFGLRYDLVKVKFFPDNAGNISPRLSVSYRPDKFDKLNLHASYGIFFGVPILGSTTATRPSETGALKLVVLPFPFSTLPFFLAKNGFPEMDNIPAGIMPMPQLTQLLTVNKKLRNSYTQQINTGIDLFARRDLVLSLNYDFVRGIKIFGSRNINPIVRPIAGDPLNSAILGRIDASKGDVIEFASIFDSYYHGLTVTFEKRFMEKIGVLAHYTVSKAIDNFTDFRSDLQEFVDPLNLKNERGLSLQDVRQRFVLSTTTDLGYLNKRLLKEFQLSTIITLESGRPYNLLAGVDLNLNGDAPPGDRPLGLARNAGITPGFASVDMRLARNFKLSEQYRLEFIIEAFNLFNRVNIRDFDRIFPPDINGNFMLPKQEDGRYIVPEDRYRNAFPPRQFQLGLRFSF